MNDDSQKFSCNMCFYVLNISERAVFRNKDLNVCIPCWDYEMITLKRMDEKIYGSKATPGESSKESS